MSHAVHKQPFQVELQNRIVKVSHELCLELPVLSNQLLQNKHTLHLSNLKLSEAAFKAFNAINTDLSTGEMDRSVAVLDKEECNQLYNLFSALQGDCPNGAFEVRHMVQLKEKATDLVSTPQDVFTAIKAGATSVRSPGFSFKKTSEGVHLMLSPICDCEEIKKFFLEQKIDVQSIDWVDNKSFDTHAHHLNWLEHFPNIQRLYIRSAWVHSFEGFKYCPNLLTLNIELPYFRETYKIDDVEYKEDLEKSFGYLTNLKTLSMTYASLSKFNKGRFLTKMPSLENLDLFGAICLGLKELANIPNLKCLRMVGHSMKGDWRDLTKCAKLERLELLRSDISYLKWVEKMPQLKHLICNNCKEIDSVDGLFERSALETLDLQGCEKIPESEWQKLLGSNPPIKGSGPCIVPISIGEINESRPATIIKV